MRIRVLMIAVALAVIAVPTVRAQTDEELAKKIKELRDQIESLQKQQTPLIAEQKKRLSEKAEKERQEKLAWQRKEESPGKKEETERGAKVEGEMKPFAKIEVRGTIHSVAKQGLSVHVNNVQCVMLFGENKELLAQAEKLAGKQVVIKSLMSLANPTWQDLAPSIPMWKALPPIHYWVRHPNYRELITQLYFRGDRHQREDQFIRPSLIIELREIRTPHGTYKTGVFDIVLPPR
jgi:Skp family chaperone for outer membrane proteins